MNVSVGLPAGQYIQNATMANLGADTCASHQPNTVRAANNQYPALFVANLGQFVSEHELKDIFAR